MSPCSVKFLAIVSLSIVLMPSATAELLFTIQRPLTFNVATGQVCIEGCDVLGAGYAVTGIGTPLNSGVTVPNNGFGGFHFIARASSSDTNHWYFDFEDGYTLLYEGGFSFSGHALPEPGDIVPQFEDGTFVPPRNFVITNNGSSLSFSFSGLGGVDVRVAAFYGMAPPCLASPYSNGSGCVDPNVWTWTFSGVGTLPDPSGISTFTGQIVATPVPEVSSTWLLLSVLVFFVGIRRTMGLVRTTQPGKFVR